MGNSIENIIYDLIKFMSLFHRLFTPALKKGADDRYNCTKNQAKAIIVIGKANKITPTILGKCMDMEKGSITTLIDSMENMNLVYRVDDPTDKRKVWIKLTEEGKQHYLKQEEKFIKKIEEIFENLSKEEMSEFSTSLKNIVEILEKVRDD